MKTVYVTNQCCVSRRAFFAVSDSGERRCRDGDLCRWPYGVRETKKIANWDHPTVKSRGAGYDIYITRSAQAVLDLLGID